MTRPRKAVIVAAGRSTRLYPLTLDTPKSLLSVGGEPMIVRSISALRACGVEEVAVVVGFHRDKIRATLGDEGITYLFNPFFASTNNMGSLWFAKAWVGGDPFVYLHADIAYDPVLLERVLDHDGGDAVLLVDDKPVDEEAMKVRVDGDGLFVESNKQIPLDEAYGEWVGITAFAESSVPPLFSTIEAVFEDGLFEVYDTEAFTRMAADGQRFEIAPVGGLPWVEVDFAEDLERARELFGP